MKKLLALWMAFTLTFQLVTPVFAEEIEETQAATETVELETEAPVTEIPTTEPPTTEATETVAPEETSAPTEPQTITEATDVTEATTPTEETTVAATEPTEETTEPTLDLFAEDENVIASGNCGIRGDNLTWMLTEDGTLTISGKGNMEYYYSSNDRTTAPWGVYWDQVTAVVIEPGVTSIGFQAFLGCSNLTRVTIPESMTSIDSGAFWGCSGLTSVTIPKGVKSIGFAVFRECSSLVSVIIPESVTSIDSFAFYGCSALASITFPENLTDIGAYAFRGCSRLTNVTIPNRVTRINNGTFSDCISLKEVIIPKSVTRMGDYVFTGCSDLSSVVIPENVTSIGVQGFRNCSSLTSIVIPKSVTSIGESAFSDCSSLASIVIPESITSIGNGAFSGCGSLTSIVIPEGITNIGYSTFSDCAILDSVTIPASVTSIGSYAFSGCSSLTSVTIPESVASIGSSAFSNCNNLTSAVILGKVTRIEGWTFLECRRLTSVMIPKEVTSIGNYAFCNCKKLRHVYYGGSDLQWKKVTIEDDSSNAHLLYATVHYNSTHIHNPEHITEKASSCTETGSRECWQCLICRVCFTDENCTQSISEDNVVLPALGHDMAKVEAVVPTYTAPGNNEYYTCARCGKAFKDEQGKIETTVEAEKLVKCNEIRLSMAALTSGSKLTLTAWAMPDNKKVKANWSLASGDETYATISSSGVLTAKTVNEVQNITVIAAPTDGSPEARKEIQILPKITVKQVEKFNLFHSNSRAELAITGGKVDYALLDGNKDFVLENENDHFYIRFANPENPPAKPNTKATLQVFFPGSDTPVTKALTIATTNTAPKLKLNPTSSILNTTLIDDLKIEAEVLGTEDESLVARSVTENVEARFDGTLHITLKNPKTTTATIYFKGNDWAKEVKLTHKITVTNKNPTVKFTAKGKLDVLNPESEIVYTPKLTNATGTITDVRLEGTDAELFNAKVDDNGIIHLKLAKSGENYSTKKTYKITPKVTLLGKEITGPTLSIKVTQSTLKLAKIPNQTVSLSHLEDLTVYVQITSPATAEIGDVQLNSKTTAALRNALDAANKIQAEGGTITFPTSTFASLKPGKYTVILDVFPTNAAADTAPAQAKFTLTVQK